VATIALQIGHAYRTKGATGTYREQEGNSGIVHLLAEMLSIAGHQVEILHADPPGRVYPEADCFIAFHFDGSLDPRATSASAFYPSWWGSERVFDRQLTTQFIDQWKVNHQNHAGYPNGFRQNNYVGWVGESFYAWRPDRVLGGLGVKPGTKVVVLVEQMFATNPVDDLWFWGNDAMASVAEAHAITINEIFGGEMAPLPPIREEDPVRFIYSTNPESGENTGQFLFNGFERIVVNPSDKLVLEVLELMEPDRMSPIRIGWDSFRRIPEIHRP